MNNKASSHDAEETILALEAKNDWLKAELADKTAVLEYYAEALYYDGGQYTVYGYEARKCLDKWKK